MHDIADLVSELPPPRTPVNAPSDAEVEKVEEKYGIKFPDDFKDFMKVYGSGIIYDTFIIFNVGSPDYVSEIDLSSGFYINHANNWPKEYHLKLWPQAPGIFPMGRSTQGHTLFWLVTVSGEISGFVIFDPKSPTYMYYEYLFTIFISHCISGDFSYIHGGFPSSSEPFKPVG
ncbi:SMI1/KNR4 family protein [Deinococcus sp. QL22]|uniref:SMI1/KNR4 family protein n=1 Tax=Deinococcus sp. QL22 TaxID=2939437 RepID=UPI002016C335|nr:SMI1/KNR4 family protein [Deinococcus sp. QL22]UQN10717.1 SMI1/KNR4 family protein [Deinococcus sp. QL22]